jgi:hypothetical protein
MNPRDFQSLALKLAAGATAAERRTAISRSYYAVFNTAAEALRGLGFAVGKGAAAHREVHRCLANSGNNEVELIASELADLHTSRNHADYRLEREDVERPPNALAAATTAAELIRLLDTTFQGPQRPKIQAAIQQWRKSNGYP